MTNFFDILDIDWLYRTATAFRDLSGDCRLRTIMVTAVIGGSAIALKKEKLGLARSVIFDHELDTAQCLSAFVDYPGSGTDGAPDNY